MRVVVVLLALLATVLAVATAALGATGAPPLVPDDPGWPGQWALRLIGVPQVWQLANPDAHPVIASIDTGVDATFPDLQGALVPGWNLVGGNADTSDTAGHGTDVAIVAVANADNGYGIAGTCPMCRIMPVKISTDRTATPQTIAAGIRWAVDRGARILIVSIVHPQPDPSERAAIDYADAHGAVVIASAGNAGDATPVYPAAVPGVVSVTGTDQNDRLYPWATYGQWVDLAAPGCEYQDELCGASYAPPVVAAAMGLLLAADAKLTPAQAIDALRATAVPVSGIHGGRIDVLAAANALGIGAAATASVPALPAFEQQVNLERGLLGRSFSERFRLATGPVTIVLTRRNARSCTMSLRSGSTAYFTWRSTANQLHLSDSVAGGVYTVSIACADGRVRPYSLLLDGLLPIS
jgi:hypothetical protein